jgi:hypothetical protein
VTVDDSKPLTYDQITQICKCGAEYTHFLPTLMTTPELINWLKTSVRRFCECGATECDIKARIRQA